MPAVGANEGNWQAFVVGTKEGGVMKPVGASWRLTVVFVVSVGATQLQGQTTRLVPEVLGEFPLCEGSAAIWPGKEYLLVGDNEERGSLFTFPLVDGRLDVGRGVARSLGEEVEISDIEAMATLESGDVVVFGSHGRNSRCRVRGNRRRFLRIAPTVQGILARGPVVEMRGRVSCEQLFGDRVGDEPILRAVCERVDAVEQIADEIWHSDRSDEAQERACEEAQAFNAEGAMAVPHAAGEAVWVGLRTPLLRIAGEDDGDGRDMAVLLRMKSLDRYMFDAAAVVDVGGGGVRELAVSNGRAYAIAGPVADSGGNHELWTFPIEELLPGARVAARFVAVLPAAAEGLAVIESTAHVIIDGDQGEGACVQPAGYVAVSLER